MLIGRNYRLAYTVAILSVIPLVSPMIICGIPFGIWALIVLHRRDVKAAFGPARASGKWVALARQAGSGITT